MEKRSGIYIILSAFRTVVRVVREQPVKFWSNLRQHIWILLPLIATQLLQKLQDLVDDRMMNTLGTTALTIHNVQYSLYGLAQEIGLITATSLLIFWKRKESEGKQKTVFSLHVGLTLILSGIACLVVSKHTFAICKHFNVPEDFLGTANLYLSVGVFNLILRSLYVPLNTILIACNHRIKCIGSIVFIVAMKSLLAWIAVHFLWDQAAPGGGIQKPMLVYSIGSMIIVSLPLFYMAYQLLKQADAWGKFDLKHALRVWPGEIGIGLVSALCPLLFSFQIAKANTSPGFFVTYQIALHLTCLLTLPVLAGAQVAVKDASAEQSQNKDMAFRPLHQSAWWPKFFYASLVPAVFSLSLAALFPTQIIHWIYGYEIPAEHAAFLPIFFSGWVLFQFGTIFLIMLRASQKNGVATRNIMISGFVVQLGCTQLLLWLEACTSLAIGLVGATSCLTFMILNYKSVYQLQLKYDQFNYKKIKEKLKQMKEARRFKRRGPKLDIVDQTEQYQPSRELHLLE